MTEKRAGIVPIRGKDYRTVALRTTNFREDHPEWGIETEILSVNESGVLIKASVKDEYGRVIGTGHAEERRGAGINATSAVENCETSAIGRALSAVGYLGQEYASDNEIEQAKKRLAEEYRHFVATNDGIGLYCYLRGQTDETKADLHNSWDAGKKIEMKKRASELESVGFESFEWLKDGVARNDYNKIREALDGVTEAAKPYVWGMLDVHQQSTVREALKE